MGSADWMPRNLDRRVEVVFPIEDTKVKEEAKHILSLELQDNLKAYYMQDDGSYEKKDRRGTKTVDSQMTFCQEALEKTRLARAEEKSSSVSRQFTPVYAEDNE